MNSAQPHFPCLPLETSFYLSGCDMVIYVVQLIHEMYQIYLQKYLQSTTVRVEEMRVKRRDAEQWMAHRMLPENLRKRIRRNQHYRWQENRGVEEEALIRNLPKDLRRDIKRHLCLSLLKKVGIIHGLYFFFKDILIDLSNIDGLNQLKFTCKHFRVGFT